VLDPDPPVEGDALGVEVLEPLPALLLDGLEVPEVPIVDEPLPERAGELEDVPDPPDGVVPDEPPDEPLLSHPTSASAPRNTPAKIVRLSIKAFSYRTFRVGGRLWRTGAAL
jgi:hypothetical protein